MNVVTILILAVSLLNAFGLFVLFRGMIATNLRLLKSIDSIEKLEKTANETKENGEKNGKHLSNIIELCSKIVGLL